MVGWALFADLVPLYPLYALLFADRGLSDAEISLLFAVWSGASILAEIPSGALADRFSRRSALAASGVFQAGAYALWTVHPDVAGFAAGFVLWAVGGAFVSGALEALLHDGLASVGASDHYARARGRITATTLVTQVPAAVAATVLFPLGGYALVGWASVATCLTSSLIASRLPETRVTDDDRPADDDGEPGFLATLRSGVREATGRPVMRTAVVVFSAVQSLDAVEEYFPLVAGDWTVPTALIPLALLGLPLAGAAGSALGGVAARLPNGLLGALLAVSALMFWVADRIGTPVALVGVAGFYLLYHLVLVVADARFQERIEGPSRATVTSVAGVATDVATFAAYAAWAAGRVEGFVVLVLLVAVLVARARMLPACPTGAHPRV